jgi:hypothetical protein
MELHCDIATRLTFLDVGMIPQQLLCENRFDRKFWSIQLFWV